MLDIIFAGATYCFALNFGNWETLSMPITRLQQGRIRDAVSFIERHTPPMERQIRSIFEAVERNYLN